CAHSASKTRANTLVGRALQLGLLFFCAPDAALHKSLAGLHPITATGSARIVPARAAGSIKPLSSLARWPVDALACILRELDSSAATTAAGVRRWPARV